MVLSETSARDTKNIISLNLIYPYLPNIPDTPYISDLPNILNIIIYMINIMYIIRIYKNIMYV